MAVMTFLHPVASRKQKEMPFNTRMYGVKPSMVEDLRLTLRQLQEEFAL